MTKTPLSVPFSISILTLMALIVVPLSSGLMWLGWRAVDTLERRNINDRMEALDDAVAGFLTSGLRTIVSVGATLAETASFTQPGVPGDEERRKQLIALLGRHPAVAAAFVGYADGHFIYTGRSSSFSDGQLAEIGAPPGPSTIVRIIGGSGAARSEIAWFQLENGERGPPVPRLIDYDPRTRPWYIDAVRTGAPALTEPYRFAWSSEPGMSAGVPMKNGGVIGFDFTLGTLSELVAEYKPTPNSIIVVAAGKSDVFIESRACLADAPDCLDGDAEVRATLRRSVMADNVVNRRVERDLQVGKHAYRLIVRPIEPVLGRSFVIAAAVPVAELNAASRILLERAALAAAIAVGLAILAVLAVSLLLSRSIKRIAAKTEHIRNLDFSDNVPVRSRITEILQLSNAVERMREGLEVFSRYVSKSLVTQIMRSPEIAGVGGVRRELSVMFTDIEGFSRISESIDPELLTSRLSRYFETLGGPIAANRGMIDKYIGDSIMAFWNAPELDPDHIANACRAALQAAAASRQLAERWRGRGRVGFRTRIGLHTGPAVVGNVGARERINYTLVGAVANQASRLEALNKVYGTDILASGEVAVPTVDLFVWRHIDRIVAAGTTEVLEIYEPLGEVGSSAVEHAEFLALWRTARAAYVEGRFDAAVAGFRAVLALRPDDKPSLVFVARCTELIEHGLPADWEGAWHFDKK